MTKIFTSSPERLSLRNNVLTYTHFAIGTNPPVIVKTFFMKLI